MLDRVMRHVNLCENIPQPRDTSGILQSLDKQIRALKYDCSLFHVSVINFWQACQSSTVTCTMNIDFMEVNDAHIVWYCSIMLRVITRPWTDS